MSPRHCRKVVKHLTMTSIILWEIRKRQVTIHSDTVVQSKQISGCTVNEVMEPKVKEKPVDYWRLFFPFGSSPPMSLMLSSYVLSHGCAHSNYMTPQWSTMRNTALGAAERRGNTNLDGMKLRLGRRGRDGQRRITRKIATVKVE